MPEIINYGFYILENQSLDYPASPAEFMEEYNSPGVGTTVHNVTINGSPTPLTGNIHVGFSYTEPLPFNVDFPTNNANKFYYIVGFYETVNNFFGFTPVQKITVINPTEYVDKGFFSLTRLSIEEIIYRRGNVNAFKTGGISTPAGSNVFAGKYYEYVDVEVYAQKDWNFEVTTGLWPAPIVRNNNTLRVYTPKNNPSSETVHIAFTFSDNNLKEGIATTGFQDINRVSVKTSHIGTLVLRWNQA